MAFAFSPSDVERVASVLDVAPKQEGTLTRFELRHEESNRSVTVEIQTDVELPEAFEAESEVMVSVYTNSSFLQLQGCTGYIASQELGEVIFFAKRGGFVSGLVIEREAACNLYANVDSRLLSTDFTQLPPEMIMSSVALSMTESLFDDLG